MVQKPETVKQVYYIFLGKHSGVLSQHKHIGWRIPVLQDVQTSQSSRVLCSAPRGSAQLPAGTDTTKAAPIRGKLPAAPDHHRTLHGVPEEQEGTVWKPFCTDGPTSAGLPSTQS